MTAFRFFPRFRGEEERLGLMPLPLPLLLLLCVPKEEDIDDDDDDDDGTAAAGVVVAVVVVADDPRSNLGVVKLVESKSPDGCGNTVFCCCGGGGGCGGGCAEGKVATSEDNGAWGGGDGIGNERG